MTTRAQLELAIVHLEQAKEAARLFGHDARIVHFLGVLVRAATTVRGALTDEAHGDNENEETHYA